MAEETQMSLEAADSAAAVMEVPGETAPTHREHGDEGAKPADAEAKPKRRRKQRQEAPASEEGSEAAQRPQEGRESGEAATEQAGDAEAAQAQPRKRRRNQGQNREGQRTKGQSQRNQSQGSRRRNRRGSGGGNGNAQMEQMPDPSLKREELEKMKVAELREKAAELELDYAGKRKAELVEAIFEAAALAEGFRSLTGILDIQSEGYGFLRTGNYMKGDEDAFVHQQLIRTYGLRMGDEIKATLSPARSSNKYPPVGRIESINGRAPEEVRKRPRFRDLTPIFPDERLEIGRAHV